ncbi:MAG: hypothetical protein BGO21_14645 [Dyadobacter sp. 50-39]|nr:MAG: hypothetical protein BGO21_14645 [Dyadobacter sp. 50-39]
MMMSSCSQEDVQVAQHEKVENGFNNERGGGLEGLPTISKTDGTPGIYITRPDWTILQPNGIAEGGTSTKSYLWGNPSFPWTKPLVNAPGANNNDANNFVTFLAQYKVLSPDYTDSRASVKLKHLKPGKKYDVTLSLASSVHLRNGEPTDYAPGARVQIPGTISQNAGSGVTVFDLRGKQAEWVTKTITFVAQDTEQSIYIFNYLNLDPQFVSSHDKYIAYMHVFVGEKAIVEVP